MKQPLYLDSEKLKSLYFQSPSIPVILSAIPIDPEWDQLPLISHLVKEDKPQRKTLEETQDTLEKNLDVILMSYLSMSKLARERSIQRYDQWFDRLSLQYQGTISFEGTYLSAGSGVFYDTPSVNLESNWLGKVLMKLTGFKVVIKS
jgi:hypothetical protein